MKLPIMSLIIADNPHDYIEKASNISINIKTRRSAKPYTNDFSPVLHLAAEKGDLDGIKRLLNKGEDIDEIAKNGVTPLYYAAQNGHVDCVKFLLEKGAKYIDYATASETGFNALQIAAYNGHAEIVELLLNDGAAIDKKTTNILDYTPLHLAAQQGHLNVVRILLEHGANVNASVNHKHIIDHFTKLKNQHSASLFDLQNIEKTIANCNGLTPLHLAAEKGYKEIVNLLIANYANAFATTTKGDTPLRLAVRHGKINTVDALINSGADFNDMTEHSLVQEAIHDKNGPMLEALLRRGADPDVINPEGFSALDFTIENASIEMFKVLIDYGAKQLNKKLNALDVDGIKRIKRIMDISLYSDDSYNTQGILSEFLDGNNESAIYNYTQALNVVKSAYAYSNRARAKMGINDYIGAIEDLDKCIERSPADVNAHWRRGICYYHLGDIEKAIDAYNAVIKIDPNVTNVYVDLGIAKEIQANEVEALANYTKALELSRYKSAKAYKACGLLREKNYELRTAIEDYTKALNLNPNDDDTITHLERCKTNLKDHRGFFNHCLLSIKNNLSTLKDINLSNQNLDDTHIAELCAVLRQNNTITSINLSQNKISDKGFEELCKCLINNRSIVNINLLDNEITKNSFDMASYLINQNSTIKSLQISFVKNTKNPSLISKSKSKHTDLKIGIMKLAKSLNDYHNTNVSNIKFGHRKSDGVFAIINALNNNYNLIGLGIATDDVDEQDNTLIECLLDRNKKLAPLVEAIKNNDINSTQTLISNKIVGRNTLAWAIKIAYDNNTDMLNYIIHKEINLAILPEKTNAIVIACKGGHLEIAKVIADLENHSKESKEECKSEFIPLDQAQELAIESSLIRKEKPLMNIFDNENLTAIINRIKTQFEENYKNKLEIYIEPNAQASTSSQSSMDAIIHDFIINPNQLSLLLLGKAGLGKTVFCQRLARESLQEWDMSKRKSFQDNLVPVYIYLPLIPKEKRSESLLKSYFKKKGFTKKEINDLKQSCQNGTCRLLLILDGFDEIIKPDVGFYESNNWLDEWGAPKVITSSRPEAFRDDANYKALFYPDQSVPALKEVTLHPFDSSQIQKYLDYYKNSNMANPTLSYLTNIYPLPELIENPFILSILVKALPNIGYKQHLAYKEPPNLNQIGQNDLYLVLLNDLINVISRDKDGNIVFNHLTEDDLGKHLCQEIKDVLSDPLKMKELGKEDQHALNKILISKNYPPELQTLDVDMNAASYTTWQILDRFIDRWLEEQTKRILNGDYNKDLFNARRHDIADTDVPLSMIVKMCLRTYCENLAKYAWNKGDNKLEVVLSEEETLNPSLLAVDDDKLQKQMQYNTDAQDIKELLKVIRSACLLTWNGESYQFSHKTILEYLACKDMYDITPVAIDYYLKGFDDHFSLNRHHLTNEPNIIKLLAENAKTDPDYKEMLYKIVIGSKQNRNIAIAAANAITILKVAGVSFTNENFKEVNITGADLSEAICDGTDFSGAILDNVNFQNAWLQNANFTESQMDAIRLYGTTTIQQPDIVKMTENEEGQWLIYKPKTFQYFFTAAKEDNLSPSTLQNSVGKGKSTIPLETVDMPMFYPLSIEEATKGKLDSVLSNDVPSIELVHQYAKKNHKLQNIKWHVHITKTGKQRDFYIEQSTGASKYYRAISPNKNYLVIGEMRSTNYGLFKDFTSEITVIDIENERKALFNIANIQCMTFSNDNEWLIVATNDAIDFCDLNKGKFSGHFSVKNMKNICSITIDKNSEFLAVASTDGYLKIWHKNVCIYDGKVPWLLGNSQNIEMKEIKFGEYQGKTYLKFTNRDTSDYVFEVNINKQELLSLVDRTHAKDIACYQANLSRCSFLSKANENYLKSKGSYGVTNPSTIRKGTYANEKELYVNKSTPSLFNNKKLITYNTWTVSLLTDPESKSNPEHAFIAIEGMNCWGELVFYRLELATKKGDKELAPPRFAKVLLQTTEKPILITQHNQELHDLLIPYYNQDQRRDVGHLFGHTWQISRKKALDLIESVKAEVDVDIPFCVLGANSLYKSLAKGDKVHPKYLFDKSNQSKPGVVEHNCFTWAREKLLNLNLLEISEMLPKAYFELLYAKSSYFLKDTPDKDRETGNEFIPVTAAAVPPRKEFSSKAI